MPIIPTQINLEGAPLTAVSTTNLFNYKQKISGCALKGYDLEIGVARAVPTVFALYINSVTDAANDLTIAAGSVSASVTCDISLAVGAKVGVRLKTITSGEVAFPINAFLNIDDPNAATGGGLTDGDKGDIVVSGSGTTLTIDANVVTTGKIADGAITSAKLATGIDAAKIGDGSISNQEFQYLNGVTSNIQTQLNNVSGGTVADDSITFAKLQNIATNKLIGRSATGTGDAAEIAVGTGLALSAGVLSTTEALPPNSDSVTEGTTNLYFTAARVLATVLTGISFATNTAVVATDSILVAFGKLQKQITDLITVVAGKENTLTGGANGSFTNANITVNAKGQVVAATNGTPGTSIVWRNAWNAATAYSAQDAVSYNGSSYYAVAASTNVVPGTDPTKWDLLAGKGDAGASAFLDSTSQIITNPSGTFTQGVITNAGSRGTFLKAVFTAPARLRIYSNIANRTADFNRPATQTPTPSDNILYEVVSYAGRLTFEHRAQYANNDSPVSNNLYWTVEGTEVLTITLTQQIEQTII